MQTQPSLNKRTSGHALLITLGLTCVLILGVSASMVMVNAQFRSTIRSQDWNAAIPVTEAGIEEAMSHLNKNCRTGGLNPTVYQPGTHGWTAGSNTNIFRKNRTFESGSYYEVEIDLTNTNSPTVFSKGYTPKALAMLSPSPTAMFATLGNEHVRGPNEFINRKVFVTTRFSPLFRHALAADGTIDFSGNNIETDSFNSRTNTLSTNGRYDESKRNNKGDVASNTNIVGAVSVGNATIFGHVSVGPGGSITIGANGAIGDRNWVENGGVGVQPGTTNSDMNVYFPEVEVPFSGGWSPLRGVVIPTITGYTTNQIILGACDCLDYASIPCCTPSGTNGTLLQLTDSRTTSQAPFPNSYVGGLTTNWTSASSTGYPSGDIRNIQTNTSTTISAPHVFPASGTYSGQITTNVVARKNQKDKPATGQFVPGTLSNQGNHWNYSVETYTYQRIIGYTWDTIGSYSYTMITGYKRVTQTITTNIENLTYNYVFDSGKYVVTELSGRVLVRGHAEVYCTGNINISGQDSITIQKNASLRLYMSGTSTAINGKGVINEGGYASDFSYYGLPSNTSISITGNGQYSGTIYAPHAHLALSGGGNNAEDFIGAAIVGSAKLSGHFKFHFDESLEIMGPVRGYVINSWKEK